MRENDTKEIAAMRRKSPVTRDFRDFPFRKPLDF